MDCFRIIITIGQPLINREAEIQRFVQFNAPVFMDNRTIFLFSDDAENGAGAPVREMVIAAVELDGAKVGQNHRAVIRVGLDEAVGDMAVHVQTREDPDDEFGEPARHAVEHIHAVG